MSDMSGFSEGDRVHDEYLGGGEVTEVIMSAMDSRHKCAYVVKFDVTPPVEYNMGSNPAMVFPASLKREWQIN
tara:strand:+ start:2566 stop:2784 length:219 start_codon:yes stop_codon:yes gene_type:complete